ncbi:hypothetical protein SDC9_189736 [bioreactor metagenome]|uniref:Uncharacterized protein n=1 Tax=bioreactor metagenome TaxID=1076179 RepID=A0A645HTJ7_9ZZZZ
MRPGGHFGGGSSDCSLLGAFGLCLFFALAANFGGDFGFDQADLVAGGGAIATGCQRLVQGSIRGRELLVQLLNGVGSAHCFCSKKTMMLSSLCCGSTTQVWCHHHLNEQKTGNKQGGIWQE